MNRTDHKKTYEVHGTRVDRTRGVVVSLLARIGNVWVPALQIRRAWTNKLPSSGNYVGGVRKTHGPGRRKKNASVGSMSHWYVFLFFRVLSKDFPSHQVFCSLK